MLDFSFRLSGAKYNSFVFSRTLVTMAHIFKDQYDPFLADDDLYLMN